MKTINDTKALRCNLSKDLNMRLHVYALQHYTTMQALVPMALEEWLAKKTQLAQTTLPLTVVPKVQREKK